MPRFIPKKDVQIAALNFKLADDRELWARQPGETTKAYQAFLDYLSMSPRSLKELAARYKQDKIAYQAAVKANAGSRKKINVRPPPTTVALTIRNWSSLYQWKERSKAFDNHQADLRRAALEADREQERQEAIRIARAARAIASQGLAALDPIGLRTNEIIALYEFAARELRNAFENTPQDRVLRAWKEEQDAVRRQHIGDIPPKITEIRVHLNETLQTDDSTIYQATYQSLTSEPASPSPSPDILQTTLNDDSL